MGDSTGISWTDATWNPVRGCSRVSEGCRHCYAEVQAARIVRMAKGKPSAYDGLVKLHQRNPGAEAIPEPRWTGEVRLIPGQFAWPLRKRKPLRIFVNSMSDVFHEKLTNEQIAAVFGVMAACPQHTFQVLTKRARRMREWFEWIADHGLSTVMREATAYLFEDGSGFDSGKLYTWWRDHDQHAIWPLSNVWLGVSVENQEAADERIPELLCSPAAVRFLSCEPLLGEVDLAKSSPNERSLAEDLDWIIAGCESGPGARPCSVEWLRSLRGQCAESHVPFFLKQATGPEWNGIGGSRHMVPVARVRDGSFGAITSGDGSKSKPGGVIELPYLDGVQHAAFPEWRKERDDA